LPPEPLIDAASALFWSVVPVFFLAAFFFFSSSESSTKTSSYISAIASLA